jgi:hypothetical protein
LRTARPSIEATNSGERPTFNLSDAPTMQSRLFCRGSKKLHDDVGGVER